MPPVFKPSRNAALLRMAAREGWSPLPGNALHDSIPVPVSSLDQMNVSHVDPINVSASSLERKRTAFAHLDAPNMDTRRLELRRDHRSDAISCFETSHLL